MQILCGETTMLATRTQKRRDGQPQSHGEERFPYLDSLRASVALWQCISVPPCLRASVASVSVPLSQKSKCTPILKKRACRTLVGRSQALVAAVENVLVTVNGQSLLNTL